jgi:hypothetical protein
MKRLVGVSGLSSSVGSISWAVVPSDRKQTTVNSLTRRSCFSPSLPLVYRSSLQSRNGFRAPNQTAISALGKRIMVWTGINHHAGVVIYSTCSSFANEK